MKHTYPTTSTTTAVPDVSVIVAAYNVGAYLRECLDSIVGQSGVAMEIVCVDDGSTDGSSTVLDEYGARDSRIRIIRHEGNRGLLAVRKTGALSARGRSIMFVDGDDVLAPGACRRAFDALVAKNADVVVFGVGAFSNNDIDVSFVNHFRLVPGDVGETGDYPVLGACYVEHRFSWNLWNKIYRTEIVRKAAGFLSDENLTMAEDLYFFFVIASRCRTAVVIKDKLYRYRIGSGVSTMTGFSRSLFEKRCQAVICLREICNYARSLPSSTVIDRALSFCFDKVSEIIATNFTCAMPADERGKCLEHFCEISGELCNRMLRSLALALMPLAADHDRVFNEWKKADAEAGRRLAAWKGAEAEVARYRSMTILQFALEHFSFFLSKFFHGKRT